MCSQLSLRSLLRHSPNLILNIRYRREKTTKKFLAFAIAFLAVSLYLVYKGKDACTNKASLPETDVWWCGVLLCPNGIFQPEQNSPLRAPESKDCMPIERRDELSSSVHHRPMWRQRNPRRREDSRTLKLCYFDSCSISDRSAECPPFCWCGWCYCSPKNKKKSILVRVLSFMMMLWFVMLK